MSRIVNKKSTEHSEQVGNKKVKMWHDKINFMQYRMPAYIISVLLVVIAGFFIITKGLNWGLDFTGGTVLEVQFKQTVSPEQVRKILSDHEFDGIMVQTMGSTHDMMIRLPNRDNSNDNDVVSTKVTNLLKNLDPQVERKSSEFVGPTSGKELTENAIWAVLITLMMVVAYICYRFEWRLSMGALLSLLHDVVVVMGVYAFLQIEMDTTFIAALLSVVGYSLNDSIVVFDRVRENFRKYDNVDSEEIIDVSLTQTLARTLITTLTTLMVVGSLLIFGGPSIYSFSLALFVGTLFGAYSSIYVAVAIAYDLKIKREHVLVKHIEKEGANQASQLY